MKNNEIYIRKQKAVAKGVSIIAFNKFVDYANNDKIIDVDGKEYIDFSAGIAVNNTGNANKRINNVVKKQMDKFVHSAFRVFPYESYIEVCEKLNNIIPIEGDKKSVLANSGAEAVENAINIARSYKKENVIIAFGGSFHGRTFLTTGLTGKIKPYRYGTKLPNPYIYHIPFPIEEHNLTLQDTKKAVEHLFKVVVTPENVAAIIVEPILGEGGFYRMKDEFAIYLRELCDKYNIVLIFDEIQSGFGRTGKMFATEYLSIKPDIITTAKGIAGGFVLSATTGKQEIMDSIVERGLGGTYAGNALSCVAALEVLKIIEEDNLLKRANDLGIMIRESLKKINSDRMAYIRGMGCMNAFEFIDSYNKEPLVDFTSLVVNRCLEEGLVILQCGFYNNTIRILNALTIEEKNLKKGLDILKKVIENI